jgi:hypothetical protein
MEKKICVEKWPGFPQTQEVIKLIINPDSLILIGGTEAVTTALSLLGLPLDAETCEIGGRCSVKVNRNIL